jgi:hypothetical protein
MQVSNCRATSDLRAGRDTQHTVMPVNVSAHCARIQSLVRQSRRRWRRSCRASCARACRRHATRHHWFLRQKTDHQRPILTRCDFGKRCRGCGTNCNSSVSAHFLIFLRGDFTRAVICDGGGGNEGRADHQDAARPPRASAAHYAHRHVARRSASPRPPDQRSASPLRPSLVPPEQWRNPSCRSCDCRQSAPGRYLPAWVQH